MKTIINKKEKVYFLVNLLAVYIIILLIRGFSLAANDVVDVMSYAKYLNNPSLYPADFYIQNIAHTLPNERIVFAGLLSLFGSQIEWFALILHSATSMFLLAGIYAIAKEFISSSWLSWFVPLLLFGPLYGYGPGDCELYYNMFIASLAAKAISIWALYFFIKKQPNIAYYLLIPATLIHPTVGAQLFLIFLSVSLLQIIFQKRFKALKGIVIFLITAGIWIMLLQFQVYDEAQISKSDIFEIFEFRLAHHFFPQYFSTTNIIYGVFVLIITLILSLKKLHLELAVITAVIFDGMIIYTLSVLFVPVEIILSSQWFKSFIWVELFAVILILSWLEKKFQNYLNLNILFGWLKHTFWSGAFIILAGFILNLNFFQGKNYDFFFMQRLSAEAEIGLLANELTPVDAVFVVPMEFTEFKYFSERSLFIDYKSVVHREDVLPEWYRRIQLVYAIDVKDRRAGKKLYKKGKNKYLSIKTMEIESFKKEGINFLVSYNEQDLSLPVVGGNDQFTIYKLE